MIIESKTSWKSILLFLFMFVLSGAVTVLLLSELYHEPEFSLQTNQWALAAFMGTIGLWFMILVIKEHKLIKITPANVIFIYPLCNNKFIYENEELAGYSEYVNYSNYPLTNKSFNLQTKDGKVRSLTSIEFRDYKKITVAIKDRTNEIEISRYHLLSKIGIYFLISIVIMLLIICLTFMLAKYK